MAQPVAPRRDRPLNGTASNDPLRAHVPRRLRRRSFRRVRMGARDVCVRPCDLPRRDPQADHTNEGPLEEDDRQQQPVWTTRWALAVAQLRGRARREGGIREGHWGMGISTRGLWREQGVWYIAVGVIFKTRTQQTL